MNVDDIILATSTNSENIKLKEIAKKHDIKFLQGSENNLFERCNDVVKKLNLSDNDYILRMTADDVCRSYEIANDIISFCKNNDETYDFISHYPKDCPTGLGSEILSVKSIKYFNDLFKENNEHLTFYYLAFKNIMKIKIIKLDEKYKFDSTITLDTEEDYNNLNKFYTYININEEAVDFNKVKDYFTKNKMEESKVCIGDSPDKTMEELNNQCKKYDGYNRVDNIYDELNKL